MGVLHCSLLCHKKKVTIVCSIISHKSRDFGIYFWTMPPMVFPINVYNIDAQRDLITPYGIDFYYSLADKVIYASEF